MDRKSNRNWFYTIKSMDENKTVSSYPFTVTLDNSEGLQNGFHVYVETKSGEAKGTVIPKTSILKKVIKTLSLL